MAMAGPAPALADTIEAALVRAYQNNPQLNAQRAQVRSTDENVPQALVGLSSEGRDHASAGYQYTDTFHPGRHAAARPNRNSRHRPPRSVGATVTQTLYNGNQTANKTRAAESQVSGAREGLRVLEQTVLLNAATIYMDYLRDAAIVEVQRSNTRVLEQTLKQTRTLQCRRSDPHRRRAVGGATRRRQDPATAAEATLTTTRSNFRRIIGNEPQALAPGSPVDRFLPATLPPRSNSA
jgi:outer membrane protein